MFNMVLQSSAAVVAALFLLCSFSSTEGFRFPINDVEGLLRSHRQKGHSSLSGFSQLLDQSKLSAVQNMKIDAGFNSLAPFLLRGEPGFGNQKLSAQKPMLQLGDFVWQSCGPADQPINIRNLTLSPSPVYLPGKLTFGFDVEFRTSIPESTKLSAKLILELNTAGSWLKIPCIGNIGSCAYDDLCTLSQNIPSCPPEFKAAVIPCKCPFNKGEYKLPSMTVEIDASVFLPGTYRAQVTLNAAGTTQLACYKGSVTIG